MLLVFLASLIITPIAGGRKKAHQTISRQPAKKTVWHGNIKSAEQALLAEEMQRTTRDIRHDFIRKQILEQAHAKRTLCLMNRAKLFLRAAQRVALQQNFHNTGQALMTAIQKNEPEIVERSLIAHLASLHKLNVHCERARTRLLASALLTAVACDDAQSAHLILEQPDTNLPTIALAAHARQRAFNSAIKRGRVDIADLLFAPDIDPNGPSTMPPLCVALALRQSSLIEKLLQNHRTDVTRAVATRIPHTVYVVEPEMENIPLCQGDTALHIAALQQEIDMVNLLQQKGASMNVPNYLGYTPAALLADDDEDNEWEEVDSPLYARG